MAEYSAIWPIGDPRASTDVLIRFATTDLHAMLAGAGVKQTGEISWLRTGLRLSAKVLVEPVTPTPVVFGNDPAVAPWLSKENYADDMLDWRAA